MGEKDLKKHRLNLTIVEKMTNDGKIHRVWDGKAEGRLWVTPEIANELCVAAIGRAKAPDIPSVARVIGSRSREDALGKDPRTETDIGTDATDATDATNANVGTEAVEEKPKQRRRLDVETLT